MFARMCAAIGAAAALTERVWIGPKEQGEIRRWLNPLLAMIRRLVLIEAIALARAAPAPRRPVLQQQKPAPRAKPGAAWSLRLWPKPRRTGPRLRQLGPPLLVRDIWRERAREAAAAQLNRVRFMRPAPQAQFARRLAALAAILERPLAAARRLAKKLRPTPRFALKLLRPLPRTARYKDDAYAQTGARALNDTFAWLYPDSS
jgi:hypothetical protein